MISKIEANGFTILPIFPEHTICVSTLPFHHRDPFDRMLISQSITENIRIISKDGFFGEYDVDCFGKYYKYLNAKGLENLNSYPVRKINFCGLIIL